MVPGEVLNSVLSFAVRVVHGFPNDPSTASPSTVAMSVDVLDPYYHCSSHRDIRALFNQDNRAPFADIKLGAVIRDSNAEGKPERFAQPINSIADVRVREFGNHNAARHRPIGEHRIDHTKASKGGDTRLITPD
jgi:hypothetical protein